MLVGSCLSSLQRGWSGPPPSTLQSDLRLKPAIIRCKGYLRTCDKLQLIRWSQNLFGQNINLLIFWRLPPSGVCESKYTCDQLGLVFRTVFFISGKFTVSWPSQPAANLRYNLLVSYWASLSNRLEALLRFHHGTNFYFLDRKWKMFLIFQ